MDKTKECIGFTSDPRVILSFHIGFSFVRATVACSILRRTSGFELSSETIAPRYLKLVTIPSFCPLTLSTSKCHWSCLSLFWSFQHLILYLVQISSRLSTRASSSFLANRRLEISLPPMLIFPSCSSRASDIFLSRNILKFR